MSSIVVVAIITFFQFSEWVIFYVLFEETSIIKIPPLASGLLLRTYNATADEES